MKLPQKHFGHRVSLSFLSLFALLPAATPLFAQGMVPTVRVAPAESKEVQQHHRVTGTLRALSRGKVAALEEGRITEITVREGATVRKGDVIARVDDRRLKAQQAELTAAKDMASALIDQRTVELEQYERDLDRSLKLIGRKAVTLEEHQHSQMQAAVAKAQLAAERHRVAEIEGQLQLLEVRLGDAVVKAPYDGRVVERHAQPGEWIRAGEPFVTLVSLGQIEAWVDVPERYAPNIDLNNDSISVAVAGTELNAPALSVKRVPLVDPRARTFPLVLTLNDEQGVLTPGMSVDAWLPVGAKKERLTVPKDAVIREGRTAYVYKTVAGTENTTAVQAPVEVLFETGRTAVVDGNSLRAGDRVIVEGNERLLPGLPVNVAPEGSAQLEHSATTLKTR